METNIDKVREIAYAIYQKRVEEGVCGDSITDWLLAEETLMAEKPKKKAKKATASKQMEMEAPTE